MEPAPLEKSPRDLFVLRTIYLQATPVKHFFVGIYNILHSTIRFIV